MKEKIIVTKLKYTEEQEELDGKFLDLVKIAKKKGYLEYYGKSLALIKCIDYDIKDKTWKKLIKTAKKYGFILHYTENAIQATLVTHKRHIKQFAPYAYMQHIRDINQMCIKDVGYKCCLGTDDSPSKKLCNKCDLKEE